VIANTPTRVTVQNVKAEREALIKAVTQLFHGLEPGGVATHEEIAKAAGLQYGTMEYYAIVRSARKVFAMESDGIQLRRVHGTGYERPKDGEAELHHICDRIRRTVLRPAKSRYRELKDINDARFADPNRAIAKAVIVAGFERCVMAVQSESRNMALELKKTPMLPPPPWVPKPTT